MMCIFLRCRRPHRPVDTVHEGLRKSSIMCATDPDQWRSTFDNLPSSCFFEELSLGLDALLGGTLQYSDLRHRQKLNRGGFRILLSLAKYSRWQLLAQRAFHFL